MANYRAMFPAANGTVGIKIKNHQSHRLKHRFRCSTDPMGYFSAGEIFGLTHSACFSPAAGLRICGKQRCEYVALRLDAPGFCRDGERRHRRGHSRSDLPTAGA